MSKMWDTIDWDSEHYTFHEDGPDDYSESDYANSSSAGSPDDEEGEDSGEAFVEYAVEGVALTAVSFLGLVGNCSSILALANISVGRTFANLLRWV